MSVKSYPNERDCEHGQLRRSCPTCAAEAAYAALRARHNALREAVEWERECEQLDFWGVAYALCRRYPGNYIDAVRADFYAIRDAARADVDRLIANEGAANCEGEG